MKSTALLAFGLLAASLQAGPIQFATISGYLHDSTGLVAQLDPGSPGYFSTLDIDNTGTFGWSYTNTTGTAMTGVRLLGFVDADLDRDVNTFFNEYGVFVSLALPPGAPAGAIAPSSWEIDEPGYVFGDIVWNLLAGALDSTNSVPASAPDDVSLALGIALGELPPGATLHATFRISPEDIGGLHQVDPDTLSQFYLNGYATVEAGSQPPIGEIPEPGTWALLGGGIAGVLLAKWRRTAARAAGAAVRSRTALVVPILMALVPSAFAANPDLIVKSINLASANINRVSGVVSGSLVVQIANGGVWNAPVAFQTIVFEDRNADGVYNAAIDSILGSQTLPLLAGRSTATLTVPIAGILAQPGNRIGVMVDSGNTIAESYETNNVRFIDQPNPVPVDLELSLLIDVSGSVDANEFNLQRGGYIAAFRNPALINSIKAGRYGAIAVNLIYWAGDPVEAVPWTLVKDEASANTLASLMEAAGRPFNGCTNPGGAINMAAAGFGKNNFDGARKVIDISGDGEAGGGYACGGSFMADWVRENATDQIDAINGLPIGDATLFAYYQQNIVAGTTGFAIPVARFEDFAGAMLLKLQLEVSGQAPDVIIEDLRARAKENGVDLTWTPVANAATYNVYRRIDGQPFQAIKTGLVTRYASYSDLGLQNGTRYYYSVRWVDAAGTESRDSIEPSANPMARTAIGAMPPTITSKPVLRADAAKAYVYQVTASDPDLGDVLTYSLPAAPPGMQINPSTGRIDWTPTTAQSGYNQVRIRVTDKGGRIASQAFFVYVVGVQPTLQHPPVFTSLSSYSLVYQYPFVFTVQAVSSSNAYPLRYEFAANGPGWTLNPSTGVVQGAGPDRSTSVIVTATDTNGLRSSQTIQIASIPNTPPVITSTPPPATCVGAQYTYQVRATDPEGGRLAYSLISPPPGMTIDSSTGLIRWTPASTNPGYVHIRAQDPAPYSYAEQYYTLPVGICDDTAPVAQFIAPASGSVVTSETDIIGTVSDEHLREWTLEYQVSGDSAWATVASGIYAIVNGRLGTIPATLWKNNPYRLRLTASDWQRSTTQEIEIQVNTGQLKMGPINLTFEDLRVPGFTFPISILRKYDSRKRDSGDFGLGWTLGFSEVDVRTDVNQDVFLTLPDARRVSFRFQPVSTGFGVYTNTYLASAGVYDTLENLDCPQLLYSGGSWYCQGFQLYKPQNFRLRTKDGLTLTINRAAGIQRIEDRVGNWIQIGPAGITSNTGRNVAFERDSKNRITKITGPDGRSIRYFYYDEFEGVLWSLTDQTNAETYFSYATTPFVYLEEIIGPSRPLWSGQVDSKGRLYFEQAGSASLSYMYQPGTKTISTWNGRGLRTDLMSDDRGNLLTERRWLDAGSYQDTVRTYDANNNLLTERDPAGNTKTFTYDAAGNRLTSRDAGGRTTTWTYNSCNKAATETDPAGNVTTYTYDPQCNLRFVKDPLNGITEYRYNAAGQRTQFIDAQGSIWTWAYAANGLPLSINDPFGKATTFTFSPGGDLLSRTDRNGRRIDFEYDAAHRLTKETWNTVPPRVTSYSYDAGGALLLAQDPDSKLAFTYTNLGQLASVDNLGTPGAPRVMMNYTYDMNGNVTRVQDSLGGSTDYSYDGLDRLSSVTQSGTGVNEKRVDMTYSTAGMLTQMRRYANLAGTLPVANTTYEYDCGGCPSRVSAIRHRKASDNSIIHDLTYTRDVLGNILTMTDADGTHNYTYDALRRLKTATHSNPALQPNEFYTYDAAGNRLTSHLSSFYSYSYQTAGKGNRLLRDSQFNYAYDDEGNLVRKTDRASGAWTEYAYDYRNRMTLVIKRDSAGLEQERSAFGYDSLDRRINAGNDQFAYDGANPVIKLNGIGSVTSRRLYARVVDSIIADQTVVATRWFTTDQVGSVRDLVSDSGGVLNHYSFDCFGRLSAESDPTAANDILFSAREFDYRVGLTYYRARWMDPTQGRFTREDPEMPFRYGYVGGNPLSGRDPSGKTILEDVVWAMTAWTVLNITIEGSQSSSPADAIGWGVVGAVTKPLVCGVYLTLAYYLGQPEFWETGPTGRWQPASRETYLDMVVDCVFTVLSQAAGSASRGRNR